MDLIEPNNVAIPGNRAIQVANRQSLVQDSQNWHEYHILTKEHICGCPGETHAATLCIANY
jgi:hypothetical protein